MIGQWPGIVTVRVSRDGAVHIDVADGASRSGLEKMLGTRCAAFVRAARGAPSLHGAAASRCGKAVVCVGESGAGKSTAIATLCEKYQFEMLADDMVGLDLLDGCWSVAPTEKAHWLLDERGRKSAFSSRSAAGAPAKLAAIVHLRMSGADAPARISRLRGADVLQVLMQSLERFDPGEEARRRELDILASLARGAPVYDVTRSRAWTAESTAQSVESILSAHS